MNTIKNHSWIIYLVLVFLNPSRLFADVPNYRGKIVFVIDQTMATNQTVITNIDRLRDDMVGDGWRVLILNVPRGLTPIDSGWVQTNGPEVRQIRALIQADYNAAPSDVKEVFLIGHVPVPYSGFDSAIVGGHYYAAEPADSFYGEMTAFYGPGGWSDDVTNIPVLVTPVPSFLYFVTNFPADGIFDPSAVPSSKELGVGRLDLYNMPNFSVDETTLLVRYLNKDHDFRQGNFTVQRRAYTDEEYLFPFGLDTTGLDDIFGTENVITNLINGDIFSWFPAVSNTNYLIGYGGGDGFPTHAEAIGAAYFDGVLDWAGDSSVSNNFVTNDSQVVFINFYGSAFGNWDETNNFLRAPLANPYDPENGRYGYGLTAIWGGVGLDEISLTNRAMGATIGEAVFKDYTNNANLTLMGDPTLRLHTVLPPNGLIASGSGNEITLTWEASSEPEAIGYNAYCAPTDNGPYSLLNTNGPITTLDYSILTSDSGTPQNFYMVRTIKVETVPIGSYTNMSEGTKAMRSSLTPYLSIVNAPVNDLAVENTEDYTNNATAFTVDADGITTNGNEQLTYQWYRDGTALMDGVRVDGSTTRALLIKNVQTNDMGNYYVVVGLADGSETLTSTPASLDVAAFNPVAEPDAITVFRNQPTVLQVLTNDTSFLASPNLRILSVSSLSNLNAGTIVLNSNSTAVYFTPTETFLGTVTFTYIMTDGAGTAEATVTLNVIPNPSDTPPVVSSITNQQMAEYSTIYIPFTANDSLTPPDDLTYIATSSDARLIPDYNLFVFGAGSNRVLQIAQLTGSMRGPETVTITLKVSDYDLETTTNSFLVTIIPIAIRPLPTNPTITTNEFSFGVTGPAGSYWDVFASADLTNWMLAGGVTLSATGTNYYSDDSINGASYRFYKLSNGNCCSAVIGFVQIPMAPLSTNLVANQLDAMPDDTLTSVFGHMSLPDGIVVRKWNGNGYDGYTNFAGVWLPNGNATLAPGEAAFIDNPTTDAFVVKFVGLVREGESSLSLTPGYDGFISSILPLAGGIQSALGFPANPFNPVTQSGPLDGSSFLIWTNNNFQTVSFDSNPADFPPGEFTGFADNAGNPVPEPQITVGQGSIFIPETATNVVWSQSLPACAGVTICIAPTVTNGLVSSNVFSFGMSGPAGSYWDVFASADLTNWMLAGGVTLGATGTNYYSDDSINGASYRFYKLSNGNCCSAVIGFVQIPMAPLSTNLVANQLDAMPDDTLTSVFGQTSLPGGAKVRKWTGTNDEGIYVGYTDSAGVWSPNGDATLAPGEAAFIDNPTTNGFVVKFVGLVREGESSLSLVPGYNFVSSILPLAGGLQSTLGFPTNPFNPVTQSGPLDNASLLWWTNDDFQSLSFDSNPADFPPGEFTGFADDYWDPLPEPQIRVGQAFVFENAALTNFLWSQNLPPCAGATICTAPTVANGLVSSNVFSFGITGLAGSYWDVFASADLTNWMFAGGVTLSGSGTNYYSDDNISGVPYRFYKLSNGNCCSAVIGFVQIPMAPLSTNLVANQLDAMPDDTLTSVFGHMSLPDGIVVRKWNGNGYDGYTNFAGVWLPNGNATLAPGEAAFIDNSTTNAFVVRFVGLVREGESSLSLTPGYSLVSSILPLAGGMQGSLGFPANPYNPSTQSGPLDNSIFLFWMTNNFQTVLFDSNPADYPAGEFTGFTDGFGNPVPEPQIEVGQGFMFENATITNFLWSQSLPACP